VRRALECCLRQKRADQSVRCRLSEPRGVRPSDWTFTASLEHRILPRASLTVVYTPRAFRGFPVVDNVWLDPSDLTPFAVMAPVDGRLPGGGGSPLTGLYDVVPEKAGQISNSVSASRSVFIAPAASTRAAARFDAHAQFGHDYTHIGCSVCSVP
jgi:hypothetical protein